RSCRKVSMRRREFYHLMRGVLACFLARVDFRIVHISIQATHLHMLVEAADARALSRGMQSFAIRTVQAIHRHDGGCGKIFRYRYHATQTRTKRYARHALAYVLNNWRRHREDFGYTVRPGSALDPYSSAISFTGWTRRFEKPANYHPLPISPPKTALLESDWTVFGLTIRRSARVHSGKPAAPDRFAAMTSPIERARRRGADLRPGARSRCRSTR